MANNINTMQIWCYTNYHWNKTKIKSIQSKLFQCLFYTNKTLSLGHLVKVLWKHLNNTNTKGSQLCDVSIAPTLVPYLLSPIDTTTLITSYPTDLAIVLTTYPTNLATLLITYPTNLTIRFRVETHKLINKFFTNV
jgi:hypothetical protein